MEHPIQPLELDSEGILRFKQNAIVRFLLESHPTYSLNTIFPKMRKGDFPHKDYVQLMQLIGYSLSGYEELGFVLDEDQKVITSDG